MPSPQVTTPHNPHTPPECRGLHTNNTALRHTHKREPARLSRAGPHLHHSRTNTSAPGSIASRYVTSMGHTPPDGAAAREAARRVGGCGYTIEPYLEAEKSGTHLVLDFTSEDDSAELGVSDERWIRLGISQIPLGVMRPSNVIAKAFKAGFHLIAHRALPLPLGSSARVAR